ncbi:hypothetical protein PG985_001620 [Apiospora marii]|uniref:uncharacterized protein n=1 Tax=Apiospora marii TaxID=335849 RepID=UPI0031302C62
METAIASNISYDADMIISRLGYRPESKFRARAMMVARGQLPTLHRPLPLVDRPSSLGLLDRFPPEIMIMILEQLDFQSLARLSRASFQADGYVRSFRDYQYLVTHVPKTLKGLARLGIIEIHSVDDLYGALQTDSCAVCGDCGPFLFLPTCQRCCWRCWRHHPAFRILEPRLAKRYYCLSKEDVAKLPVVHVRACDIRYNFYRSDFVFPNQGRAVSAKAAWDLGLVVHGSEEELIKAGLRNNCNSADNFWDAEYWLQAPKIQPHQHWLVNQPVIPQAPYRARSYNSSATMPTMPFPIMAGGGRLEQALWCRGCRWVSNNGGRIDWGGPPARLQSVLPLEYLTGEFSPMDVAYGLADRAWSRDTFLQHVRRCPVAYLFAPKLADIKDEEWDRIISTDMKR